jgi:Host cell surface-exposed lipoprotein
MKLVLKITLGILLACVMLIGGCTALIAGAANDPDVKDAVASLDNETVSDTKKDEHPDWTSGQLNAVESAESYLDGQAFSKEGLRGQLTFEEYTEADAMFAVNHVKANWKAEAVESAESYLDGQSFSKPELLDQLLFEEYTQAQAEYAVGRAY